MHRLWEWVFLDGSGAPIDRPASPVFTSRFEAEEWLGAHWRVLAAQGVGAARLEHAGVVVGPPVVLPLDRLVTALRAGTGAGTAATEPTRTGGDPDEPPRPDR